MGSLTRRGWFRRVGGVALGLALARELPGLAPKPPGLMFHKDAFALAMQPLNDFDVKRFVDAWARAMDFPGAKEMADRIRNEAASDLAFVKGDTWPS